MLPNLTHFTPAIVYAFRRLTYYRQACQYSIPRAAWYSLLDSVGL